MQLDGYSGGCAHLRSAWSWFVGHKWGPPLALGPTFRGVATIQGSTATLAFSPYLKVGNSIHGSDIKINL